MALKGVSFTAPTAHVVGVLGENGAGKSTLVKILAGAIRRDAGRIAVGDVPLQAGSPREALRAGVALVPQELAYLPSLSVAENILLGRLPRRNGVVSRRGMMRKARHFADRVGLRVSLDRPMSHLSLADAQLVEIAKGIARNARVLLLDEPTAALSQQDSDRLFATVAALAGENVTVLCISHRLDEVLEHTDSCVVLRDGRVALDSPTSEVTKRDLVGSMLGSRKTTTFQRARSVRTERAVIELQGTSHTDTNGLRDASFHVRGGEIVGLFSVRGGGQEAALETVTGLRPHQRGRLLVDGQDVGAIRNVREARKRGIVGVPPDRKRGGLILSGSVVHNAALPQLGKLARTGIMRPSRERAVLEGIVTDFALKFRSPVQPIGHLSGGNQQKVLVGSRIAVGHRLIVLHEPTRGVDVGARREIHQRLSVLASSGSAVLFASTDVEEAVELADRLYILRDGTVIGELAGDEKTPARALSLASGDPL
ncbi:sugar ABC transporter ATP-binding protein [Amycolatopsis pigmentata]|uniref:Sugar ABC transporter ATP-binding protein n=1 Tax=Amycolatopsis pigmentata TaxID=450801 RepID=A0ABW5FZG7_9PSEU